MDHRIRQFLATGNPAPVVEKPPGSNAQQILARLDSTELQQVLPAPYRRALAARPGNSISIKVEAGWITLTVRTLMKAGFALAVVGAIGCANCLWQGRRSPEDVRTLRR
jgi:hypothetical protein